MKNKEHNTSVVKAIPLALQHVVAMVVGCVTVPRVVGSAAGLGADEILILMQASLLCAGIAILIHTVGKKGFGSGLPIIVGSGFAFMPTLISIATSQGLDYVLGAQLIGSIVGIIVGVGFKKIRFLFPPVVTSSIIIVVGISLYKTAIDYMAGGFNSATYGSSLNWIIAIVTVAAVILFQNFGKGAIKVSATLLGLIVGYILAACLGQVDASQIFSSAAFSIPQPLHFGMSFSVGAIVSLSVVFIINAIQDMGQFEATASGVYNRVATDSEISGGVIGDNIASMLGSVVGGVPVAAAGQNVGIVTQTKVTDKIVFILAALIIIVTSFVPMLTSVFLTIPLPVLGGATIGVFGSIAMTGIRMLANAGLTPRNLSIAGISVAAAVGVATVSLKGVSPFAQTPEFIQTIFGGSELVIVAFVAIILNLVLPKEKN
ncbi:MAG: uracil-xanthine permease family protein [Anaerorhabdus sp.]